MGEQFRGTHVPVFLPGNGCGCVRAWFVRERDQVTQGQRLAEIVPAVSDGETDSFLSSEYDGVVGCLSAKLGVHVKNKPILEIIIDQNNQQTVECYSDPAARAVSDVRGSYIGPRKRSKYDTEPIVASIAQLQKKRRETVAKMESMQDKDWYRVVLDEIDDSIKSKRILLLNMYKELKEKEQRKYNSGYLPFSLPRSQYDRLTKDIPRWPIAELHTTERIVLATDDHEAKKSVGPHVCGLATSTYPYMDYKNGRDGDPICDQFRVVACRNHVLLAIADGCNWGNAVAEAATKAAKGFTDMMNRERHRMGDTNRLCNLFLSGMCAAHNAIIQGDDEDRLIGTTTLMGAMVVPLEKDFDKNENALMAQDESDEEDGSGSNLLARAHSSPLPSPRDDAPSKWGIVICNVGDCKAFVYTARDKAVLELTPDSRSENASDAKDCGGRLGPYVDGGPDLRNLATYVDAVENDDILFFCSDGVHDNFDPQHFGITASSLGLDAESWLDADADEVNAVKSKWRQTKMKEVLGDGEVTPELVVDRMVAHCQETTRSSQTFMQENLGKKLPSDYVEFPGKMDHTTIVAVRVGEIDDEEIVAARKARNDQRAAWEQEKARKEEERRLEEERVKAEKERVRLEEERAKQEAERAAQEAEEERRKKERDANTPQTLVQHVKATALALKKLSAVAKEGGPLVEFELATERAVGATTALLEYATSGDRTQDVSMVKAISAKAIVGSKKLYAHRYASDEERAAYAAQLDKLLAGSATVLKKLVQAELQSGKR